MQGWLILHQTSCSLNSFVKAGKKRMSEMKLSWQSKTLQTMGLSLKNNYSKLDGCDLHIHNWDECWLLLCWAILLIGLIQY